MEAIQTFGVKGFTARLEQRDMRVLPQHTRTMTLPDSEQADGGTISAIIAPATALTPEGRPVVLGGGQDSWEYNREGYLVHIRKIPRKALFQQQNEHAQCESRNLKTTTVVRKDDNNNEDITDQYFTVNKHQQHRVLKKQAWTGETMVPRSSLAHQQQ